MYHIVAVAFCQCTNSKSKLKQQFKQAYRFCSRRGDAVVGAFPLQFRSSYTYRQQIKCVMPGSIRDLTRSLNSLTTSVIHQHIHCLRHTANQSQAVFEQMHPDPQFCIA